MKERPDQTALRRRRQAETKGECLAWVRRDYGPGMEEVARRYIDGETPIDRVRRDLREGWMDGVPDAPWPAIPRTDSPEPDWRDLNEMHSP